MKSAIFALALVITQCVAASMDMRTTTIQLVEDVYNRKNANALNKYYDTDAELRDNIFNGKREEIRGLERIKELHYERCGVFNYLGAVFTIEDSVVSIPNKTIRYVLAMHSAMLGKYQHDVIRLSVLHRFNADGMIILTETYGDMTSIEAQTNRSQLSESEINRMKALLPFNVANTHKQYHVLDDLVAEDAKIYFPEATQQGKGPIGREEAIKIQQEYDMCITDQKAKVMYVLHEQSRPDEVALVWKWSGNFVKQCPAPYGAFKPSGQEISVCGVTQYQFCRNTGRIIEIRNVYDTEDIRNQMQGGIPKMLDVHSDTGMTHMETA